ncbi:phosphatidylglycerol lysyltransferase domain-containing protein [Streptococcus hongkongensis]|nr:membrane protein [Streptococcus uberis]
MTIKQFLKKKHNLLLKEIVRNSLFYLLIALFYLSGITLVLMITSHDSIINFPIIKDKLYGLTSMVLIRQVPSIIFGFALLVGGRAIANRARNAFYPTLGFLVLTIVYTFIYYRLTGPTILLGFLVILLYLCRSNLYRKQLVISHENIFVDGIIWLFLIISYLILGFLNLVDTNHPVKVSLEKHFSVPSFHWWLMGLSGILVICIVIGIFLYFLKKNRQYLGKDFHSTEFEELLLKGDHHYAGLAYLLDKKIWYYQVNNENVMALLIKTVGDKVLVMGDFLGDKTYLDSALTSFIKEADLYNFHPVFYEISEKQVLPIHDFGFEFMKLGEEGLVKTDTFNLSGKKKQNLRSIVNQTQKAGYHFSVIQAPFSDDVMQTLETISKEWLNGRKEMTFSLGFFDPFYLSHAKIAILTSPTEEIIAFASLEESFTENSLSVDLMRYSNQAPKAIMDVLFIHIIAYAKEQEIAYFNLGMSPLSNVGQYKFSFFTEKLGNLLYQYGSQIYSFEGLRKYKEKFAQEWEPYYIAYSKQSNFLFVVLALLKASNTK